MTREKMKQLMEQNNAMLAKVCLFFFLIPCIIGVLNVTDITHLETNVVIIASAILVICSILPYIFYKNTYNEEVVAQVCLYCIEVVIVVLCLNPFKEMNFLFFVVPILSMFYFDPKFARKICVIGYIFMFVTMMFRYMGYSEIIFEVNQPENVYLLFLELTLDYVIMSVIICLGSSYLEDVLRHFAMEAELECKRLDIQKTHAEQGSEQASSENMNGLVEERYDVERLFKNMERDMEALVRGKNKVISVDLDPHLPVSLWGAKNEIKNAISSVASDLLMMREDAMVRVYVTYDEGINPKNKQNMTLIIRISSQKEDEGQSGQKVALGSFMSQEIVALLKGSFEDLSDETRTLYQLSIVQRVADECTIEKRSGNYLQQIKDAEVYNMNGSKKTMFRSKVKILVVDDNKEACKLMDAILYAMGVETECVHGGAEAVEKLSSKDFQMVFIDHMMPEKSGIETEKEIRLIDEEYYHKLPIVLMTINGNEENKKNFVSFGFTDCINKPLKESEVREVVMKYVKDDYPLTYEEYRRMQNAEGK